MDMFHTRFKKEGIMKGLDYRKFILQPGRTLVSKDSYSSIEI